MRLIVGQKELSWDLVSLAKGWIATVEATKPYLEGTATIRNGEISIKVSDGLSTVTAPWQTVEAYEFAQRFAEYI